MIKKDHNFADYSSELHIRKKRLLDQSPNGGRSVQLTMAPYIVNILRNGVRHCSGTILHPDIILSVISCTWTPFPVSVSILSNSPMRNEGTHHNITNQVFGTVNYLGNSSMLLSLQKKKDDALNAKFQRMKLKVLLNNMFLQFYSKSIHLSILN